MLRIIGRSVNAGAACNVGGPVETVIKTWQVSEPDIEAWLRQALDGKWEHREIIGVEIVDCALPITTAARLESLETRMNNAEISLGGMHP